MFVGNSASYVSLTSYKLIRSDSDILTPLACHMNRASFAHFSWVVRRHCDWFKSIALNEDQVIAEDRNSASIVNVVNILKQALIHIYLSSWLLISRETCIFDADRTVYFEVNEFRFLDFKRHTVGTVNSKEISVRAGVFLVYKLRFQDIKIAIIHGNRCTFRSRKCAVVYK